MEATLQYEQGYFHFAGLNVKMIVLYVSQTLTGNSSAKRWNAFLLKFKQIKRLGLPAFPGTITPLHRTINDSIKLIHSFRPQKKHGN